VRLACNNNFDIFKLLMSRQDIKLNNKSKARNSKMLLKRDTINGNVILHDLVSNKSCDIKLIRDFVKTCPSCVNIKNNDNKTPLDIAIENELSVDIIATLLLYSSTSSSSFSLFSSNKYSSHPLYGPLVKLLQSTKSLCSMV